MKVKFPVRLGSSTCCCPRHLNSTGVADHSAAYDLCIMQNLLAIARTRSSSALICRQFASLDFALDATSSAALAAASLDFALDASFCCLGCSFLFSKCLSCKLFLNLRLCRGFFCCFGRSLCLSCIILCSLCITHSFPCCPACG